MSIGTGIFLGLCFLGLIWLYVATWQRWRWKRIVVVFFSLIFLPVFSFFAWGWVTNYLDSQPHLETQMWDLKLGMSTQDVLFRKGEPNNKEKDYWFYTDAGSLAYLVRIHDGHIWCIEVRTKPGNELYLPTIQGVNHYSSQEDIEGRFGKPDLVSVRKDYARRQLSYNKYGLTFELERNQVISVGVFNRKFVLRYAEEAESNVLPVKGKP